MLTKKNMAIIVALFIFLIALTWMGIVKSENATLVELEDMEYKYEISTGFWNDDEDSLKKILCQAVRLRRSPHSGQYKSRIDKLISDCKDEL